MISLVTKKSETSYTYKECLKIGGVFTPQSYENTRLIFISENIVLYYHLSNPKSISYNFSEMYRTMRFYRSNQDFVVS